MAKSLKLEAFATVEIGVLSVLAVVGSSNISNLDISIRKLLKGAGRCTMTSASIASIQGKAPKSSFGPSFSIFRAGFTTAIAICGFSSRRVSRMIPRICLRP